MLKQFGVTILAMFVAGLIAVGYGHFVYPVNPLAVWALLFFCWLCYRLRLRALATFGPRERGNAEQRRRHDEIEHSRDAVSQSSRVS